MKQGTLGSFTVFLIVVPDCSRMNRSLFSVPTTRRETVFSSSRDFWSLLRQVMKF